MADVKAIQSKMTEEAKYKRGGSNKRKYTDELDCRLKEIVTEERKKSRLMGATHKQKLTNIAIPCFTCTSVRRKSRCFNELSTC